MTTTLRPPRPAHTDLRSVLGTRVGFWLDRALDLTVRGAADLETGARARGHAAAQIHHRSPLRRT